MMNLALLRNALLREAAPLGAVGSMLVATVLPLPTPQRARSLAMSPILARQGLDDFLETKYICMGGIDAKG
tara:strand:- start:187 stop:399 length:213 start_codon:yes stop_codon:yes gene_type:complete